MLKEFKEFALKGNAFDLAVGVIIGGAFQKIVTSVINDLVMPFVGLVTGSVDFTQRFLVLKVPEGVESAFTTLQEARDAGATVFAYGAFITAVVDFIIMAFVIFLMVKLINKVKDSAKKKEAVVEAAAPAEPPKPTELDILMEIRDQLVKDKN